MKKVLPSKPNILNINQKRNPNLFVYGCDFSSSAIEILKSSSEYNEDKCKAFVCDITDPINYQFPFQENQLDFIVMIFVLSAIKPEKWVLIY